MNNTNEESLTTRIALLNDIIVIGYDSTILRLMSDEDKLFIQKFQYASTDEINTHIDGLKEQLYKQ